VYVLRPALRNRKSRKSKKSTRARDKGIKT
jgi:hypothetical protein